MAAAAPLLSLPLLLLLLPLAAASPAAGNELLILLARCPGELAPSDARAYFTAAPGQGSVRVADVMAWAPGALDVPACCLDRLHMWQERYQDWGPVRDELELGSKVIIGRAPPNTGCRGCGYERCSPEAATGSAPSPTFLTAAPGAGSAPASAAYAALRQRLLQRSGRPGVPPTSAAAPPEDAGAAGARMREDRRRLLSRGGSKAEMRKAGSDNATFGVALYEALTDPSVYSPNVLPNPASAGNAGVEPVKVDVRLALYQIVGIDLYGGFIKLAVWLQLEWSDPRLQWDPKDWNNTRFMYFGNPSQGQTDIWVPDVTLWNSASPMVLTLGMQAIRAEHNGRMFWARDGYLDVACNFQGLQKFPFGEYSCDAEFGSWNFGINTLDLRWLGDGWILGDTETSVKAGDTSQFKEYYLTRAATRRMVYPPIPGYEEEGEQLSLIIRIFFSRGATIYAFKVLVPQIMLTTVSLASLWLSPECGERLGLAITVPLAVAVYDLLTFSSVPISNRITYIAALGLVCFLTSILVLVEVTCGMRGGGEGSGLSV